MGMRECTKCHQLKDDSEFYVAVKRHQKDITKIYSKECKDCICKDIDINNYDTYDKYLKELDLPYFEDDWNKYKERHPTAKGTFGRYKSLMNLCSFSFFHYKDNQYIKELQELKEKFKNIGQ